MNIKNTLYLILLLAICFGACKKNQFNNLDHEYLNLFETAKKEYKYGHMHESHSKFLEILHIADKVSSSKENQRIHLIALNYLGDITLKAGAKKLAYTEFENALELAKEFDNEDYQIQALLNMVRLEDDLLKVENRLKVASQKFAYNAKNKFSLDQIKYALGLLYAKNKKTNEALDIFNSLLLSEKYNKNAKAELYKGLGITNRYSKDFNLAIAYFDTALLLVEDKTIMQLEVLIEKAQTYYFTKEYDKFKCLISDIEPEFNNLKDLTIKKRINELQISVCDQTKDIHGKAKKLTELQTINEKIEDDSKALLVSILTNQKNLELRKETEAQEAKRLYLKFLFALVILLFASIITSLFLFYNHTQLALRSFNIYIDRLRIEIKRLAGDLHDILAANLAVTRLEIVLLKKYLPSEKHEKVLKMLADNIEETRRIAYKIIPPVLVNGGLITAIKTKVELWNNESLQYKLIASIEEVSLYDELKFDLYRCILECINNIIKYAQASEVIIEFALHENDLLHIEIIDNGIGFDVTKIDKEASGLGIYGMRSRVEYFEGKFQIKSNPGEGTSVNITVPMKRSLKKASIVKRLSKKIESLYLIIFRKDNIQGI